MKRCCTCKVDKPFEEFSKNKKNKDGLHQQCKSCKNIYYKIYYSKNKENINKKRIEYYENNQEQELEKKKQYRKENRAELTAKERLRKACKINATPKWLTKEQKKQIIEIYKFREKISKETGIVHNVDHIVPLQSDIVCGLHVPWNLRVIPQIENIKKSNKLLDIDQNNQLKYESC